MSMPDITDDLLLGDDDELDYDLAKDEEDALLAEPDNNFDDTNDQDDEIYEEEHIETYEQHQETAAEEDVLDLGVNENLDETDDFSSRNKSQVIKHEAYNESYQEESFHEEPTHHMKIENDDYQSDQEQSGYRENRFSNERNNIPVKFNTSIPDNLDNIPVTTNFLQNQQKFNNNRNNVRFRGNNRGHGRGRGVQNHMNRGSVFNRIGNAQNISRENVEGKTVHINPHFRGNVHINSETRLAWDATGPHPQNPQFQQGYHGGPHPIQHGAPPMYQNPQCGPAVWDNPLFPVQQQYNQQIQPIQSLMNQPLQHAVPPQQIQPQMTYHENQPQHMGQPMPFNQPAQQPVATWNQEPNYEITQQGNFRGREIQYIPGQPSSLMQQQPPPLVQHQPPHQYVPNQNQYQPNPSYNNSDNYQSPMHQNQQQPLLQQPVIQNPNYPPPNQNYPPPNQNYPPQNQFNNFNQHQQQQQQVNNQNNQYNQFNNQNSYRQINRQQNNQINQNRQYKIDNNRGNNLNLDQQNMNNRNQQNFNINQHQQRTPPKRRSFDNTYNKNTPSTESPKKKKRSMELGNLHEVKIVDLPDSTNKEDKTPEFEDDETKAYRRKIEEQKRLRERLLQQKEARRKLTAQSDVESTSDDFKEIVKKATIIQQKIVAKPNNIQIKTTNIPAQKNIQPQKILQKSQTIQQFNKNPNQKQGFYNQNMQNIQKINQQNINMQQKMAPNIVITQKNDLAQNQPRRIVLASSKNVQTVQSANNRRVVLNSSELINNSTNNQKTLSSDFLSNRKVVETPTGSNLQGVLIKTPVVTVSNLAVTTTDDKIRKLCQGLGPIKTIQMKPSSREATIQFKNIISAHRFFKKYQRKIIDLSMIQVTLVQPDKA